MDNHSHSTLTHSNVVEKGLKRLLKHSKNVTEFVYLLFRLVPDNVLHTKTSTDLMTYVLDNHESSPTKCKAVLQYVIGLIEYNLIDVDAVDIFYFNYYKLLNSSPLVARLACQLIYMLTKDPTDLSLRLVLCVKDAYKRKVNHKSLNALLMLFKSLRPDLVPDRIPAFSLEHAFPLLPMTYRDNLEKTKQDRTIKDYSTETDIQWAILTKKTLAKNIPDAVLLNVGSLYEKEWEERTLIEYDCLIELQSNECSTQLLSNACSLLNSFAGRHFLTFSDESLKIRLTYYIKQALRYEINQLTPMSTQNRKEFFQTINELYNCAQQGIPDLSNLILEYLEEYKNFQMDATLLDLLSWTVVQSFDDLHARLLRPLRDIFITRYSASERCDIIECISNLITNFATTQMYPNLLGLKQPFKSNEINEVDFLKRLGEWLNYFTIEAMKVNDDCVLWSILGLHETFIHVQQRMDPVVWMGAPPRCLTYACLGVSLRHLDTYCKILSDHIEIIKQVEETTDEVDSSKEYIRTFATILNGRTLKEEDWTRTHGKLRRKQLSYNIVDTLFLLPYAISVIRKQREITFNLALEICAIYFPHIHQFLITD